MTRRSWRKRKRRRRQRRKSGFHLHQS